MNQSSRTIDPATRVAFVQARWHADIVDRCREGFLAAIGEEVAVEVFDVPGAYEIPLLARDLARTGRYDAIVAAAFVVDGGIYRHEFVAETVVGGLMQAQFEADVPMLSAVLTPHHFQETEVHRRFFLEHFALKGREAAEACRAVLALRAGLATAA